MRVAVKGCMLHGGCTSDLKPSLLLPPHPLPLWHPQPSARPTVSSARRPAHPAPRALCAAAPPPCRVAAAWQGASFLDWVQNKTVGRQRLVRSLVLFSSIPHPNRHLLAGEHAATLSRHPPPPGRFRCPTAARLPHDAPPAPLASTHTAPHACRCATRIALARPSKHVPCSQSPRGASLRHPRACQAQGRGPNALLIASPAAPCHLWRGSVSTTPLHRPQSLPVSALLQCAFPILPVPVRLPQPVGTGPLPPSGGFPQPPASLPRFVKGKAGGAAPPTTPPT